MASRRLKSLFVSTGAIISAPSVATADSTVYVYDPLGRLVRLNISGGNGNGRVLQSCFDAAGNRVTFSSGTAAVAECPVIGPSTPAPTPTPTPTPGSSPPTTVADGVVVGTCDYGSVNVIANDSEPGGHVPLTVVSVSGGTRGAASVESPSNVGYSAYGSPGGDQVAYTVRNTAGVTATGTIAITVVDRGGCN